MVDMFGHAWVSQHGVQPSVDSLWIQALAGMTVEQIERGLVATSRLAMDWPPSVGRFRAMCLGIPSLASTKDALRLRSEGDETLCAFARLVWSRIDAYRYRLADADRQDRMIAEAYEIASEHVMRDGGLPDMPAGQIEPPKEPERRPASPEVARVHIAEIDALLGIGDPVSGDPTDSHKNPPEVGHNG